MNLQSRSLSAFFELSEPQEEMNHIRQENEALRKFCGPGDEGTR